MIFVTVGAQICFDRLVSTVDHWASSANRDDVFAQIGVTSHVPRHMRWVPLLSPNAFREKVMEASLVVSHAGMGSILTALQYQKPILVLPRRGALKETRNDHQVATAKWLSSQNRVAVALDEEELIRKLDSLDDLGATEPIRDCASEELLASVRDFIMGA